MIFLIILLIIAAIITLLLITPAVVQFSYINGKLYYSVKYFFYPITASDKKKKIKKAKKEKNKHNSKIKEKFKSFRKKKKKQTISENDSGSNTEQSVLDKANIDEHKFVKADEKNESNDLNQSDFEKEKSEKDKKDLSDILEKIDFFLDLWNIGKKHLAKICKGFHFSKLYINFKISDEDAYNCALKYGRMCFAVYNSLELLNQIFTVKVKSVDVNCVFAEDNCIYDISFTVRFRLGTAVSAGLGFLITYYFKIHKPKKNKKKHDKNSPVNAVS